MAIKYIILTAIVIRLAIGDLSLAFKSPLSFPSEEKNWTVIYMYELDEVFDELLEFKRCVVKLNELCHTSGTTKKCGVYCGVINKEIGWIEKRLNYIKTYDVIGSKYTMGRKNTFKMQTIGETTYIKEELPTTFLEILNVNRKLDTLRKCRKCQLNVDDYRHTVNTISMIQLAKMNEIATVLEYLWASKCDRVFIPITIQRLFSYLIEVERIIQDSSLYEPNATKIKYLAAKLFDATVVNNTFRINVSIPLKLKDCVRQKTTSSSVFASIQHSGQIQIKN